MYNRPTLHRNKLSYMGVTKHRTAYTARTARTARGAVTARVTKHRTARAPRAPLETKHRTDTAPHAPRAPHRAHRHITWRSGAWRTVSHYQYLRGVSRIMPENYLSE